MRFWEGHAPHTVSLIDLKFDTQVQLHVLYKKASWTMKLRLPRFFLPICIMWKTVKWIEILKNWLYQQQIWYAASGDEKTYFYKWARLVKKHGSHGPVYFCNGLGLEMIGHNSDTLCPIITKLGGRGLFVINHHCLCFINLWRAGRTQRHETWYVEYKWRPNAAPKFWSQSVTWGLYNM